MGDVLTSIERINYLMNGVITWLIEQKKSLVQDHMLDIMNGIL